MEILKAPFPYFGGKSRVASEVWARFGDVKNYVEPFFGSGACLLARPTEPGIETVNDLDGLVANFWRALQSDPEAVAHHADNPVNENDLHARHLWLVSQKDSLQARLEGDPDFFDVKIAGWWVWGISCWIGSGWCSGNGPWQSIDGLMTDTRKLPHLGDAGRGVSRQLPHLGDAGNGVHRKRERPHLGNAGMGVKRERPHLGNAGMGVKRERPHLGDAGRGVHRGANSTSAGLAQYLAALADRLRSVRVCCGDWSRVCGPSVTHSHGLTGVFLDPPYSQEAGRDNDLYRCESGTVAHDVREWAIEAGKRPDMRIALCGYDTEHADMTKHGWAAHAWRAHGGYGNQGNTNGRTNAAREVVWFSPACLPGTATTTDSAPVVTAPAPRAVDRWF